MAKGAVEAATTSLSHVLDSLAAYNYEDEYVYAVWNDWQSRDQVARMQKTFNSGRYSREKRTLGFVNGRWYICYKQAALKALGHKLDDE